jgi:hypothetical protein
LDDFGSGILVNDEGDDYFDSKNTGTKFEVCIHLLSSSVQVVDEVPDDLWLRISQEA